MDNVESLLSRLFEALQVIDPTNYIPLDGAIPAHAPAVQEQAGQWAPAQQRTESQAQLGTSQASAADGVIEDDAEVTADGIVEDVAEGATDNTTATASASAVAPDAAYSCPICLERVPAVRWRISGPCTHGVCDGCARAQVAHAARARHAPVSCATCGGELDGAAMIALASDTDAPRVAEALAAAAAGTVRYCSNVECGEAVSIAGADGAFSCPRCASRTCASCGVPAHDGVPCAGAAGDDDLLAGLAARRGWTHCPGCRALVSKDSSWSCNYAVCMCGAAFCIRCGAPYSHAPHRSRASGRARNQHGSPSCQCGLYER